MSYTNQILEIKKLQKEYCKIQEKLSSEIKDLKRELEKLLKDTVKEFGISPSVYILLSFTAGSFDTNWSPTFYLYNVRDGNNFFIKVEGKWVYTKQHPSLTGVYSHNIERKPLTFDPDRLEEFTKALAERACIPVEMLEYKLLSVADIKKAKNTDDLRTLHPGCTVLTEGKKLYEWWDIGDPYAIIQAEDGIHIYYATNGHGFGYDKHVVQGDSFFEFLSFLDKPEQYLPPVLLKKLEETK